MVLLLSSQVTVQLSHLINALQSLAGSLSSNTSVNHKHRENTPEQDLTSTEVITFNYINIVHVYVIDDLPLFLLVYGNVLIKWIS